MTQSQPTVNAEFRSNANVGAAKHLTAGSWTRRCFQERGASESFGAALAGRRRQVCHQWDGGQEPSCQLMLNGRIPLASQNDNGEDEDENVNGAELWRPVTLPPQLFTGIRHSDSVFPWQHSGTFQPHPGSTENMWKCSQRHLMGKSAEP